MQALGWLQHNFWLPNLHRYNPEPSNAGPSRERERSKHDEAAVQLILEDTAATLRTHLASYRRLSKEVARDASLKGPNKAAMSAAQSRIVSCVRHADGALSRQRANHKSGCEDDGEAYDGADILAAVLLEPGGLIPLSRK